MLACEAGKRSISQAELARAAYLFMEQEGVDSGEIHRTVNSAYLRVGKSGEQRELRSCHDLAKLPYGNSTDDTADDEESEKLDGERLRERTPTLPEAVFELIPEFLSAVVKYFDDPRERDVILLSSITILSGCMHTTYGYYVRYCLMTYRICMVFTTLEKGMMRMPVKELACSDQHFEAALAITTTCLEHARLLNTGIKKTDKDTPELENPNKMACILEKLPQEFTTSQFNESALDLNIPKRTSDRMLRNASGKCINKLSKGVYEKNTSGKMARCGKMARSRT